MGAKKAEYLGRPPLKEGEPTKVITFKVPGSLWDQVLEQMEKLEFKSKGAYIRHSIELEMKGGKQTKSVNWLTRCLNKIKQENVELRDQLHDKRRKRKTIEG